MCLSPAPLDGDAAACAGGTQPSAAARPRGPCCGGTLTGEFSACAPTQKCRRVRTSIKISFPTARGIRRFVFTDVSRESVPAHKADVAMSSAPGLASDSAEAAIQDVAERQVVDLKMLVESRFPPSGDTMRDLVASILLSPSVALDSWATVPALGSPCVSRAWRLTGDSRYVWSGCDGVHAVLESCAVIRIPKVILSVDVA